MIASHLNQYARTNIQNLGGRVAPSQVLDTHLFKLSPSPLTNSPTLSKVKLQSIILYYVFI